MLERFGVPSRDDGSEVDGGLARYRDDDADADLIRRTAAWLRVDGEGAWAAGLTGEKDVRAMTALLDMLATELPRMDASVRRATVDWCRVALGEPDPGRNGSGSSFPPGRPHLG
jgi:hypothetical protein